MIGQNALFFRTHAGMPVFSRLVVDTTDGRQKTSQEQLLIRARLDLEMDLMFAFSTSQTKTVLVPSRCWFAILFFAPLLVSCRKATQTIQSPAGNGGQVRPYAAQLEADDGQWVRATKDYANTRYSTLDQINTANVGSLKVAWTFDTGVARGQEAAPIVANNTMYVVAPWPNALFALDLTKPGGPLKWKFEPNPSPAAKRHRRQAMPRRSGRSTAPP